MGRLTTVLEVIGMTLVAVGVGWIYPPAGVITAGVELVTGSVLAMRERT